MDVHDTLAALAPITAVHGNVCDGETAARLPERAEVEVGGVRIGVVHIPGASIGRHARLREWFPECDVVVYGHTHMPELERADAGSLLVINPGSPVQRRRAPWHSACWLEVADGAVVAADLVRIDPNRTA
jgi:putative phosphoesterase